jgi:predicted negative regulator of RcsB-dependent stress response
VDRITRKGLKTDKFAQEVGHGFEYFTEHQQEAKRYGTIALIVLLVGGAYYYYHNWQNGKREQALNAAMRVDQAYVGDSGPPGQLSFPTQDAKDKAVTKAYTELAQRYPGTEVGTIALYTLGTEAADKGDMKEAEKDLKQAAEGQKLYASLARLALARIYGAEGRVPEAEKLLRDMIANPTVFVSKEQAIFALAEVLAPTRPAEARKLLEPLRTERSAISRNAITALGELDAK